jgi:hypothetical protein
MEDPGHDEDDNQQFQTYMQTNFQSLYDNFCPANATAAEVETNLQRKFISYILTRDAVGETVENMFKMLVGFGMPIDKRFLPVDTPSEHRIKSPLPPLTWAIVYNTNTKWLVKMVEVLIQLGATPNVCDDYGWSPLMHTAARMNQPTDMGRTAMLHVAQLLLDSKADIFNKDKSAQTALHLAAGSGACDLVKLLIDRGAVSSDKAIDGSTALHCAAHEGKEAVVKALIDAGADVRTEDNFKRTAEALAHTNGYRRIEEMLHTEETRR